MADVFDFCPGRMVAKTKPPADSAKGVSMNGWNFSSRPNVPYQRTFSVKLQGLTWYLQPNGLYNYSKDPRFNAHRLERFYQEHGTWSDFDFPHPHLGIIRCRFSAPVEVPEAVPNSGGFIDGFEITLIEHNPAWQV